MIPRGTRLLAVAALAIVACSSDDGSSEDYTMGEPGEPGTVVRSEELDVPEVDGTIWDLTYRSETVLGEPTEVTALVAQPSSPAPDGGYPVLSWGHGTAGLADECAPSQVGAGEAFALIQPYLDAGYVVAASDYEGLGGPGAHPYLVSGSEARSVLDAARAARVLVPETSERLLVVGGSQGGHAALATAEFAADWAPELDLVATVAIAPLADLTVAVPVMFSLPAASGFAVLVAAGWADAYPGLDASDVLGPAGVEIAERAVDDSCVAEVFADAGEADPDALVAAQPDELDRWRERIEENTIRPELVTGPLFVAQGTADQLIPAELTDRFVQDLCAAGADVVYQSYEGADHGTVFEESDDDIIAWLAARLAGEPDQPTC